MTNILFAVALFTKSYGGTISIIENLTAEKCAEYQQQALPYYARKGNDTCRGCVFSSLPGEIDRAKCLK